MNQLQDELKLFEKKKPELLSVSRGKFVLIKKHEVVGVFDTEVDAINQGYSRFGNSPFLVKQVLDNDAQRTTQFL